MNFSVVWRAPAEQRLAHIWNTAPDRQAVTAAANAIDLALKRDPLGVGESRIGSTRILLQHPLGVFYDVSEPDRLVTVWAVWRTS